MRTEGCAFFVERCFLESVKDQALKKRKIRRKIHIEWSKKPSLYEKDRIGNRRKRFRKKEVIMKKLWALVLAWAMLLTVLPFGVLAKSADVAENEYGTPLVRDVGESENFSRGG